MIWLWTILIGAAAFALALWAEFRISNRHALRLCRAIPIAPSYYPVLGNALLFTCSLEKMTENLQQILVESMLNGQRAVCFWFGAYPLAFITDPADIKTILNNSLSRGKELEESGKHIGVEYGLISSPVDYWKVTRRHLNLSFHPRNLEQLMPTFNSTSRQLVADLSGHVDGAAFDLMPHVMSAALKTICIFLYGPRILEFVSTEQLDDLAHAIELSTKFMSLRIAIPWLQNEILFKLLYGKEVSTVKTVFLSMWEIANTNSIKRDILENNNNNRELLVNTKGGAGNGETTNSFQTVIDAMRELQERVSSVTDQRIMEEMVTFLGTGTDTIAASVSSCLLALARFPHIQDKVFEEICSVVSEDDNEDIAHLDLRRLPYLDQVIKETLRFFTVVPFVSRAPTKDVDLGGYTIPANKFTALYISAACLNPKYFPDPYKFDPDRFSSPNDLEDVFMPFSRGPRNCIGKNYAMMLINVMVIRVVLKYRLSTNMDIQKLKKRYKVSLVCCDGYNVFLSKRSQN